MSQIPTAPNHPILTSSTQRASSPTSDKRTLTNPDDDIATLRINRKPETLDSPPWHHINLPKNPSSNERCEDLENGMLDIVYRISLLKNHQALLEDH